MDQWLRSLPKGVVAFVAIALGIVGIIFFNPPRTLCDTQLELLSKSQEGFLSPDPNSRVSKTSGFQRLSDHCKTTNSPGGCYELFQRMNKLLDDLKKVPDECVPEVSSGGVTNTDALKPALYKTLKLLAQLAWGESPPRNHFDKLSWLDAADISLFCRLKSTVQRTYDKSDWETFQESLFRDLPGAAQLPRGTAWNAMILSLNCSRYP